MFKPQKIINTLEKICLAGSAASLLAIMFATSFEVISRRLFDFSIPSLVEIVADYMMVTLIFFSLSYVFVKGGHVRVTLFLGFIPKHIMPVLDKLIALSALVLFALIAILSWQKAVSAFQSNEISSSLLAYPMGPVFLIITIGVGLMVIRLIQSLVFSKSIEALHDDADEIHID